MASEPAEIERPIRFGEGYEIDLRLRRLRRGSQILKLERIPFEILLLLLEHRDEIVRRDQIVSRVWGQGVFLDTDNSIRGAIRKLRQVLRDDAETPRFIQTVTGRGYRFIAPIMCADAAITKPADGREAIAGLISEFDSLLQSHELRTEEEGRNRESDARPDAESDREPGTLHTVRWFVLGAVALLALLAVVYLATRRRVVDAAPGIKSLAVLPLKNLSGD